MYFFPLQCMSIQTSMGSGGGSYRIGQTVPEGERSRAETQEGMACQQDVEDSG